MNVLFDRIEIMKIQFEDGKDDVKLTCKVCQGDVCTPSTLIINYTDLNRLLARLSLMQVEIDFSFFEVTRISKNENIYEFDAQNVLEFIPTIEQFEISGPYRQICA
jgi:hypothetical protein